MIPGPFPVLALAGPMGAGKTTLGRRVAERLGWSFHDGDAEVERDAGRPIAEIFAAEGEARFRALEEAATARLLARDRAVVALGGGAVLSEATRRRLRERAFTVLIDIDEETAWRRARAQAGIRPLAADRGRFGALLRERAPAYRTAADALVDGAAPAPEEPLLVPFARPGARDALARLVGARRAALVADRRVLGLLGAPVGVAHTIAVPAGEAAKQVAVAARAWGELADARLERDDVVVGLGGGAATDLAGFVAATYQRGVPWIAVPTTLVGMVDAAIGGKTAIDLPAAKNYVGAFHPPEWIVADPDALETLPDEEWANGMAEVVKTALLAGGRLWDDVRAWPAGRGTPEARLDLIRRCAALKARVVAADPREGGLRAVLNLGHTIGHALESAAGHGRLAHGAAVAAGLPPALWLSARLAGLDAAVEDEVRAVLARHGLPTTVPGLREEAVLAALARDKKRRGGRPRFVLLEAVGRPAFGVDVDDALVRAAVRRALAGDPGR